MKSRKIFWGIFFILAAVYIVVSKFGVLPDLGVLSIVVSVFFIWTLIEGVRRVNFYQILFSLAFFYIIYDEPLGIAVEELTPLTVLGAALLASIGLSLLFHGGKKRLYRKGNVCGSQSFGASSGEQCSGSNIQCENHFGSAIRYINSDDFQNARIENNFGSLSVYFDNAIVQTGSAVVNVENNFGKTRLYVPKEWKSQNNLEHSFGSINEVGGSIGTSNTVFYINGSANFGVINIHYI